MRVHHRDVAVTYMPASKHALRYSDYSREKAEAPTMHARINQKQLNLLQSMCHLIGSERSHRHIRSLSDDKGSHSRRKLLRTNQARACRGGAHKGDQQRRVSRRM
jgi:hypothetical protein